jgi:hypothetical protein
MCQVCKKAEKLPVEQALRLVADEMAVDHRSCLDEVIGRLIGLEEPTWDTSESELKSKRIPPRA